MHFFSNNTSTFNNKCNYFVSCRSIDIFIFLFAFSILKVIFLNFLKIFNHYLSFVNHFKGIFAVIFENFKIIFATFYVINLRALVMTDENMSSVVAPFFRVTYVRAFDDTRIMPSDEPVGVKCTLF